MSNTIQFDCLYCLNPVTALKQDCGREIPCPHCRAQCIVPSRSIDAGLYADILDSLRPEDPLEALANVPSTCDSIGNEIEKEPLSGVRFDAILDEAMNASPDVMLGVVGQGGEPVLTMDGSEPDDGLIELIPDRKVEGNDLSAVPLKVEGLELGDLEEVLTVKCKICDSRVHTNASNRDREIECPDCYAKILVTAANILKSKSSDRTNQRETKLSYGAEEGSQGSLKSLTGHSDEEPGESELVLLPITEERPVGRSSQKVRGSQVASSDGILDRPSGSLSKVGDSVSTPHEPETDAEETPAAISDKQRPMSRRERYEAAQRRLAGLDDDHPPPKKRQRPKRNVGASPVGSAAQPMVNAGQLDELEGPSFEGRLSLELLKELLASPGLKWRTAMAGLIIGVGSALMHGVNRAYFEQLDPSIGEEMRRFVIWLGMGALPYALGVALLWLVSGIIFRETVSGERIISNWKLASFSDFQSTVLIFAFSYFIAGLPLSPLPMMYPFVLPLRFLIAPLFLLAAWYNQHPFGIVAVDAFRNFGRDSKRWGEFYAFVIGLAMIGFIGGLLLMVPWPLVSLVASLVGAMLVSFCTVAFSAVAGWHCGWVVDRTK